MSSEPAETTTAFRIRKVTDSLCELLFVKNQRYGDSALHPLGIFSKEGADNQICNRLDDKLARIKSSNELHKNDVADVLGYLVLLCAQRDWTDFDDLID